MASIERDLRSPTAWGAAPGEPVAVVETHISWVFLVGARAYKVKRPVDLGFLDFSTAEARRAACEAEVALNARLAPDVYRGVRPIVRAPDGTHRAGLPGEADAVDWAVEMVRLDDGCRADVLLAHDALAGGDVERLADHVADFHARCRGDEATAVFGLPDRIGVNVRENFAQTRGRMSAHLSPAEANELERRQLETLVHRADLFRARAAAGRVRDGHGDLRLEHVYLGPTGAITIVDCIEFNERFRYADVAADVAFLSMDLAWHGRVDLAERLLARYARISNDYDLYSVVDFYEAYRAFVRGKISLLLASDRDASPASRARGAREARRYFVLALSGSRPVLVPPSVVAIAGLVASGKTTLADRVGLELAAPVVEADRTRKHLLGVAPTTPLVDGAWRGAYDLAFTDRVYEEVLRRAHVVLASGRPVVVDASFRSREMRARARALAATHRVPFHLVECRAPDAVLRERLAQREAGPSVSDGRLAMFDSFKRSFEPVTELRAAEHVVVDTTRPIDECVAVLRRRLGAWPRGLVA